jgi:hypothetical protein
MSELWKDKAHKKYLHYGLILEEDDDDNDI